jgi:opacity protein-like surface antigen
VSPALRFRTTLALSVTLLAGAPLLCAQGASIFVMGGGTALYDRQLFNVQLTVPASTAPRGSVQDPCPSPGCLPASEPFSSGFSSGGRVMFGAEVSMNRILGIEGSYAYGRNNLTVTDLGTGAETGYGARLQRFSGDFVLHAPVVLLGIRPYALAGLEYDRLSPTAGGASVAFIQGFAGSSSAVLGSNNMIGFNYGGGVEYHVLPLVSLRLDIRDHVTGSPGFGLPSSLFPTHGVAHDLEYLGGIELHFRK